MEIMKGNFRRVSPSAFAERVGIPAGWFVVSHRWLPEKSERRISHGRWFKIKSEHGEVFRILRFSPNLEGGPTKGDGEMVLDWPAWLQLFGYADNVDGSLPLELSRAQWWHWPKLAVSHPDPVVRLSGALGLLSLALGIVSLFLGIAAL
jgi:hypothetical protein